MLDTASEEELAAALRAIYRRLEELDDAKILNLAGEVLATSNTPVVTRLHIGTDEWDNGYFYQDIENAEDGDGNKIILSDETVNSLDAALGPMLSTISYSRGPLGRRSRITIDLTSSTLYED
ncbi:MAG: hypothetical protein Q7T55_19620 [Solirubrobacteraceae bacterium]|nr:hypothetical protein [Solirubrobacteraceae bacterium]